MSDAFESARSRENKNQSPEYDDDVDDVRNGKNPYVASVWICALLQTGLLSITWTGEFIWMLLFSLFFAFSYRFHIQIDSVFNRNSHFNMHIERGRWQKVLLYRT